MKKQSLHVAILGATGFVGRNLLTKLTQDKKVSHIRASYRSPTGIKDTRVSWAKVNLDTIPSIKSFLKNIDVLVYLIHSLEYKDHIQRDVTYARRISRTAKKAGVKRIVYVGGILRKDETASGHLRNRVDTGKALAEGKVDIIELRPSIIIGKGSESFTIIYNLAKRFPLIFLPTWLKQACSPIGIDDVVLAISSAIHKPSFQKQFGHHKYNIGTEPTTYFSFIKTGYKLLRPRGIIMTIPTPKFLMSPAGIILSILTGATISVGMKLVMSLKNNTSCSPKEFEKLTGKMPQSIRSIIQSL